MLLVSLRSNLDKFRIVDTKPENYSPEQQQMISNQLYGQCKAYN